MAALGRIRPTALALLALVVLLLLAWRAGLLSNRLAIEPAPGSTAVSTTATIRLVFRDPMDTEPTPHIRLVPDVPGQTKWVDGSLRFVPDQALAPETSYRVTLDGEVKDARGRGVALPADWSFTTRSHHVLFLATEAGGGAQLFAVSPGRAESPARLTPADLRLYDYAVAPHGDRIAFSAEADAGGLDLWLLEVRSGAARRWIDCGGAFCSGPSWSPDGGRLIYERRDPSPDGVFSRRSTLWWAAAGSDDTVPVFEDAGALGRAARLSPDGRWLSYVWPTDGSLRLVELTTGSESAVVSQSGEAAAWAPDGRTLAISSVSVTDERPQTRLLAVDPESSTIVDLSGVPDVSDGAAAWSPDGDRIAFTRRPARVNTGKQLMLVRPDGAETRVLTGDPTIHHGPPRWSPDGRLLVFQRVAVGQDEVPAIWLLTVESGVAAPLAAAGYDPAWLP